MSEKSQQKQRKPPSTAWSKGQSGNPAGKPKGCLNRSTRAVLALMEGEAEGLSRVAVDLALSGDISALRLCLDRIAPPRKDNPVVLPLPDVTDPANLAQATAEVVRAAGAGEITPSEGAALAGLLEAHRKAAETTSLTARLDALEAKLQGEKR